MCLGCLSLKIWKKQKEKECRKKREIIKMDNCKEVACNRGSYNSNSRFKKKRMMMMKKIIIMIKRIDNNSSRVNHLVNSRHHRKKYQ